MKKLIILIFLLTMTFTLSACEGGTNEENQPPAAFDINDLQTCITDIETTDDASACEVNYRNQLFKDFASQYFETFDYPNPVLTNVMFAYAEDASNNPFFSFNLNLEEIPAVQSTADYNTFRLAFEELYSDLSDLITVDHHITYYYEFENDEMSIGFGDIEGQSSRTTIENADNSMTDMIGDYDDFVVSMSSNTEYEVVVFKLITTENIVTITMWPVDGTYQTVISELVTTPSMTTTDIQTLLDNVMVQTTLTELS